MSSPFPVCVGTGFATQDSWDGVQSRRTPTSPPATAPCVHHSPHAPCLRPRHAASLPRGTPCPCAPQCRRPLLLPRCATRAPSVPCPVAILQWHQPQLRLEPRLELEVLRFRLLVKLLRKSQQPVDPGKQVGLSKASSTLWVKFRSAPAWLGLDLDGAKCGSMRHGVHPPAGVAPFCPFSRRPAAGSPPPPPPPRPWPPPPAPPPPPTLRPQPPSCAPARTPDEPTPLVRRAQPYAGCSMTPCFRTARPCHKQQEHLPRPGVASYVHTSNPAPSCSYGMSS